MLALCRFLQFLYTVYKAFTYIKKRLKTKKAETFASTFDMIAYDHRKSNKRIGRCVKRNSQFLVES
jgi:hypothetical protein